MKKIILLQISIMFMLVFSYTNSNAQCGPVGNGTNGGIHCMFPDSMRNCLFVGGGFHNSGNDTMNHCGYWNDSTYLPMSMMGHNGCNDSVWCFTMFNGDLYVGGNFTQAGGVACNHIARWDGTSWYPVGDGFNQEVHALAVYNNELYAGGEFTMSGTTAMNYFGRWSGTQWNQVNGGMNDDVEAMCVWNNALYIGGDFTMAGGMTMNRICKWDGVNFSAVGTGFTTGMGGQCMVHSFCIFNGNLYAGGMFEHAGTMDMHNLAMWNGSTWSSIGDIDGSGMGDNLVSAMCAYNGHLFIGGNFGSCGSTSSSNLGMWNGSSWTNIGTGMNGVVNSLAVFHNELYISGSFTNAAGTSVSNIAKYSANTGIQLINDYVSMNVYPNPAGDYIQISWTNEQSSKINLKITDVAGRVLYEQSEGEIPIGFYQVNIPVDNFSDGIYFVTLNAANKKYSEKFQIIR